MLDSKPAWVAVMTHPNTESLVAGRFENADPPIECYLPKIIERDKRFKKQEFQENSHLSAPQDRSGEEIYENREQIELSKLYEQLPKPTQLALYEFENDQIYFKDSNDQ